MAIIMSCAELNVAPPPLVGGTLSPTSLIISAVLAFGPLRRTRRTRRESRPDDSPDARREEKKWDTQDSVPPGDGWLGGTLSPNVPDHFGGIGVRAVEADAAHDERK